MDTPMYTRQQQDQECILGDTPNIFQQQHHSTASTNKPAQANTFVHKLYNMVLDAQYQHLIAWSYMGSSFIVCNIVEFSRAVLPKHFKHNNFSSFVRQLNMYGFHKLNKSPRGHRTMAENQIWEFSHPNFLRDRPDLLDDIKRKVAENTESARPRDTSDLQSHLTMMQAAHSEMMQRIDTLLESCNELAKELAKAKRQQGSQDELMKNMLNYIAQQNQGTLPLELIHHYRSDPITVTNEKTTPSIFVTSPDAPMSIQTQQFNNVFGLSTTVLSDDENSLYSPHSPHTPTSHSPASFVAHHHHPFDPLTHTTPTTLISADLIGESSSAPTTSSSSTNNVEFTFVVDPIMEPLLRR